MLSRTQVLKLLPGLAPKGLTGAVRYYDGLTNDSRLVLDTLRSAVQHGASVWNYTRFVDADTAIGYGTAKSNQSPLRQPLQVAAKCIVNATGPWSHQIPHSQTSLRLTKGVHLVLDRARLPVPDAVVITEGDRILFVIPWGERIILGTTDTDYQGPIGSPTSDPEDIRYVLEAANRSFPEAQLKESDVIGTWAGLRPLVADRHGNPSDISRRHEVKMSHPGWWDVTGGKLTTYRLMGEETVDQIVRFLAVSASPCRTAEVPLLANGHSEGFSGDPATSRLGGRGGPLLPRGMGPAS